MTRQSFQLLKDRVDFTSRMRLGRFEVFSRQAAEGLKPEGLAASPDNLKSKATLIAKGLGSFSKSGRRGNMAEVVSVKSEVRRRRLAIPQDISNSTVEIMRSPTLEDLLAFNKSTTKRKASELKPVSYKRLSQKAFEPLQRSNRQIAFRSSRSFQKPKVIPTLHLEDVDRSDYAFISVGSLTPHRNIWEEQQLRSCRTPRILRVSPRG